VLNRRLFSTVRERKRLTYDANFHLTSFERMAVRPTSLTHTLAPSPSLSLSLSLGGRGRESESTFLTRQLTQGGWYLVTVTAKPELAQKALDACKETLQVIHFLKLTLA